ncbi:hypothetical protein [Nodosilinea sp. P-1105]|uniref:hypothetical protein n=1 Tax=Nodosilinea sp. P-1105 TaxID=2546229 RepID=UPI00146DFF4F|nr:hypothetical protein [Nodosilinea sp. P-1105]
MVERLIQRWQTPQAASQVRPQTVTRFGPEPGLPQDIAGVSLWQPHSLQGVRGRQWIPEPVAQDQPLALQSSEWPLVSLAQNPFIAVDDRPQGAIAEITETTARSLASPLSLSPQLNSPADTSPSPPSPPSPPLPHSPTPHLLQPKAAPPLEAVPSSDGESPPVIAPTPPPSVSPLLPRVNPPSLSSAIASPAESTRDAPSDVPTADQPHQDKTEPAASLAAQAPTQVLPPASNVISSITPAVTHSVPSEAAARSQDLFSPAAPTANSGAKPVSTTPPTVSPTPPLPHSLTPPPSPSPQLNSPADTSPSPHSPTSPSPPLPQPSSPDGKPVGSAHPTVDQATSSVKPLDTASPRVAPPSAPQFPSPEATLPPVISSSPPSSSPRVRPVGSGRSVGSAHPTVSPTPPLPHPITPHPLISPSSSLGQTHGSAPTLPSPITVTIGRIDIRTTPKNTPPPLRRRPNPAPSLSLKDYLDRRNQP